MRGSIGSKSYGIISFLALVSSFRAHAFGLGHGLGDICRMDLYPSREHTADLIIADLCAHEKFNVAAMECRWAFAQGCVRTNWVPCVAVITLFITGRFGWGLRNRPFLTYGGFRFADNKSGLVQPVMHALLLRLTYRPHFRTFLIVYRSRVQRLHLISFHPLSGSVSGYFALPLIRYDMGGFGGSTHGHALSGGCASPWMVGAYLHRLLRYVQSGAWFLIWLQSLPSALLVRARALGSYSLLPFFGAGAASA